MSRLSHNVSLRGDGEALATFVSLPGTAHFQISLLLFFVAQHPSPVLTLELFLPPRATDSFFFFFLRGFLVEAALDARAKRKRGRNNAFSSGPIS